MNGSDYFIDEVNISYLFWLTWMFNKLLIELQKKKKKKKEIKNCTINE